MDGISGELDSKFVSSFAEKYRDCFDIPDDVATSSLVQTYVLRTCSKPSLKVDVLDFVKILCRNVNFVRIASERGILSLIWKRAVMSKMASREHTYIETGLGIACNSMQLMNTCPFEELRTESGSIMKYAPGVFRLNLLKRICDFLFIVIFRGHYVVTQSDLSCFLPFLKHLKRLLSSISSRNRDFSEIQVDQEIFSNKFTEKYDFSCCQNIKYGMEVLGSSFLLMYCITEKSSTIKSEASHLSQLTFKIMLSTGCLLQVVKEKILIRPYCQLVCNLLAFIVSIEPKEPLLIDLCCPKKGPGGFACKVSGIEGYSAEFHGHDVSSIIFFRYVLDQLLKSCYEAEDENTACYGNGSVCFQNSMMKYAIGCVSLCKQNKLLRKYLRFHVFPPLKDVYVRPEEEISTRGRLVTLMSGMDPSISNTIGEFLFVLCKNSKSRLIKYCGMGNSMGYLNFKGLLLSDNTEECSSDNSETDEYKAHEDNIDIMTGCLKTEPEIDELTDEEKEKQFEKLMDDIEKLKELGIISPASMDDQGRITGGKSD